MSTKTANKPKAKVQRVKLSSIRRDPAIQGRAGLDPDQVESCQQAVREKKALPRVVVFEDDDSVRWLAGGFHRAEAHEREGKDTIEAEVRKGTRRDAMLYAIGDNAEPGVLRRTDKDKRRAVEMLLDDPEWSKWPQAKIARAAAVSPSYVTKIVHERQGLSVHSERTNEVAEGYDTPLNGHAEAAPAAPERLPGRPVPADTNTWRSPAPTPPPAAREPGDDTEEVRKEKAEDRAKPKNGAPLVDSRAFEEAFGRLYRLIDDAGNAFGQAPTGMPHKDTPAAENLRRALTDYRAKWDAWVEDMKRLKRVKK